MNFLTTHKPYVEHKGQKYYIEDIASYHIHADDYYRNKAPKGGHSNYKGYRLPYFNHKPNRLKPRPLGAKDVIFYNSRQDNLTKPSSLYSENWTEEVCDFKAIEVATSDDVSIVPVGSESLRFEGKTSDGLDIIVQYNINYKRINTHYVDARKL